MLCKTVPCSPFFLRSDTTWLKPSGKKASYEMKLEQCELHVSLSLLECQTRTESPVYGTKGKKGENLFWCFWFLEIRANLAANCGVLGRAAVAEGWLHGVMYVLLPLSLLKDSPPSPPLAKTENSSNRHTQQSICGVML